MVITYKNQDTIKYPVYILPSNEWYEKDKIIFLGDAVLDDKNQAGKSLGIRRMQTPFRNLYRIRRMVHDWTGILKVRKQTLYRQ